MDTVDAYRERLALVQDVVKTSAAKAGRNASDVRIVGVTKTVDASAIPLLLDAGITEFGENRWQHARELIEHPRAGEATWHYIGHLQSNKVKYVVPNFSLIHSIDSLDLASEIEQFAHKQKRSLDGLIQVNVSGEETKFGVEPEEVMRICQQAKNFFSLRVVGLMTMAPQGASEDEIRTIFRSLRSLRDDIAREIDSPHFMELSMGMSEDFGIAVEEGATMIRVGRRLMGFPEK